MIGGNGRCGLVVVAWGDWGERPLLVEFWGCEVVGGNGRWRVVDVERDGWGERPSLMVMAWRERET